MDPAVVQRTRYLLRSRFQRVQRCPPSRFLSACRQLYRWLSNHPVMSAILHGLGRTDSAGISLVRKIREDLAKQPVDWNDDDMGSYEAADVDEHASVCFAILEALAKYPPPLGDDSMINIYARVLTDDFVGDYLEALTVLREVALDGVLEYLDERLDAGHIFLALIQKYKQRSEWFHRQDLRNRAKNGHDKRKGERALAADLYAYLLDQSIEFFIEPVSGTGKADMVLRDPNGRHVPIDVKYLRANDSSAKLCQKLAEGFHQVVSYCEDYNEPIGYLVAFSESRTRLEPELEESDGFRFLRVGARNVYFVEVSIADAPSASKLGRAKVLRCPREQLLRLLPSV